MIAALDSPPDVAGLKVLLVEDESLVAMLAQDMLVDAGFDVVLSMRLKEALEIARTETLDVAVLDINLGAGDTSLPVAEMLDERGIPFMFASGYDLSGLQTQFKDRPRVQKPYSSEKLMTTISAALSG
jgi:CheY-like chemotaxis protein